MFNKIDLLKKEESDRLKEKFKLMDDGYTTDVVRISVANEIGLEELKKVLIKRV